MMVAAGTGTQTLCYDADFCPYGGEDVFTNTCAQNYKFDGKERDPETGNDYFGARFYSSTYGRFLSADWSSVPSPVPYANLSNPQTLNLYAFVHDNPVSFADLDGHDPNCSAGGINCPGGQNSPRDPVSANQKMSQSAANNAPSAQPKPDKKQIAKGGGEVLLGVGIVVGILQPEVGIGEVIGGTLAGAGFLAKGASDVGVGAAGGGDTSEMKETMDMAQNPISTTVVVVNGGNVQQANNVGDVVSGATAVRSLAKDPHGSAFSLAMAARDVYAGAAAAGSLYLGGRAAYNNIVTPPPSPHAPAAPDVN